VDFSAAMNRKRLIGSSPWRRDRRFCQDVAFLTQHAHLFAQLAQVLAFDGGQAVSSASIDVGPGHPAPHRGLGQVQIATHFGN
jgi:hypothetical protein